MNGGFVGVLTADLHLLGAASLKDKRKPLHSLKAALTKATGGAVAEVDDQDILRRARLTVAVVTAQATEAARLLDVAERVVFASQFEILSVDRSIHSVAELSDSHVGVR